MFVITSSQKEYTLPFYTKFERKIQNELKQGKKTEKSSHSR